MTFDVIGFAMQMATAFGLIVMVSSVISAIASFFMWLQDDSEWFPEEVTREKKAGRVLFFRSSAMFLTSLTLFIFVNNISR